MFFFHLYSRKIYDPLVCSRGDRNRSAVIDPAGRPFVSEKKGKDAAKARDRGSITLDPLVPATFYTPFVSSVSSFPYLSTFPSIISLIVQLRVWSPLVSLLNKRSATVRSDTFSHSAVHFRV